MSAISFVEGALPASSVPVISVVPADLIQAYRETHYRVAPGEWGATPQPGEFVLEERFTLEVGQTSAALHALHHAARVNCSAFITACNPFSQTLTNEDNRERMNSLKAELAHRSLRYLLGEGAHPNGQWPAEPSVLVLGISREAARRLGEHWGQNAIVWCGEDARPELWMLR